MLEFNRKMQVHGEKTLAEFSGFAAHTIGNSGSKQKRNMHDTNYYPLGTHVRIQSLLIAWRTVLTFNSGHFYLCSKDGGDTRTGFHLG